MVLMAGWIFSHSPPPSPEGEPRDSTRHQHLEVAHRALHESLKTSPMGVETFVGLPQTFYELARLYERYGAFEGALELLGKVTEYFPHWKGYAG